jgi:hypothetical protein
MQPFRIKFIKIKLLTLVAHKWLFQITQLLINQKIKIL